MGSFPLSGQWTASPWTYQTFFVATSHDTGSRDAVALIRYAASGVLRNRRRTFSSILGVLLAITFVAGTFIAIDSSTRSTLDALLADLQGDFSYYAYPTPTGNASDLRSALDAVLGVTDASVYRMLSVYQMNGSQGSSLPYLQAYAIDPDHLPASMRGATVEGSLALPRGTIALSSDVASSLQAGIGDDVQLVSPNRDPFNQSFATLNLTVAAVFTPKLPTSYFGGPPGYIVPGIGMTAVRLQDADWVEQQLNVSQTIAQFSGEVWIDRARFVNPYDMDGSAKAVTRLGRQLQDAIYSTPGFSGNVNDNLSYRLSSFSLLIAVQRIQFLVLSFPVLLLGLYLGAVGVDLGHAERRRELAVLKTRGASRRQVIGLLILESIFGGLAATVVGLVFGVALSRFLMSAVAPSFGTSVPDYGPVSLTPSTIVTVAILSVIFMMIASYRSARRTAGLPIVETLHYYSTGETRIHYSPLLDAIFVGYSAVAYVGAWYVRSATPDFFIFLIGIIFVLSLPVVPILLVVGVTRLLTRSTGKVYHATARLFRPFAKNLEYIISRNLSRNPRRSANIAIIIALGLAFGVFVVSALGSQQAYQERLLRASVGGDMAVGPAYTVNGTMDPSFAVNLSKVSGVAHITHVETVMATTPYMSASIVAVDPSTYFAVTRPESFYFLDPGADAAADILATNGSVLVTQAYQNAAALEIGDRITLTATIYANSTPTSVSVPVVIGGIVRMLPGTELSFYGPFGGAPSAVYASNSTVKPILDAFAYGPGYYYGGDRYLVALAAGADWRVVKQSILGLRASSVDVYQEDLEQLNSNPLMGSFLGFVKMEIAFIVVILTAGLGLIIYAASLERDVEFAGIMARGASGWQAAALLMGEAFSILLVGLLIGLGVGLATGLLYISFSTTSFGAGVEPAVPMLFVLPPDGLLLLLLTPVAMLGTALLVSWRIAHMNIARVLKMRGG